MSSHLLTFSRGRMTTSGAKRGVTGRVFTIELDSGDALKKVNVPNGTQRILLEGTIGALEKARFMEDAILELAGTGGVLRVDLSRNDLARSIRKKREEDEARVPPTRAPRFNRDNSSIYQRGRLRHGKGARDTS